MRRILPVAILYVLLIASFDTTTVLGCAISPGDPWYKVDVKVVSNPLSDVLGISFTQNGGLVTFTNRGLQSDLVIASKDVDGIYPGYMEQSRNYRPTAGIIGNDKDPNILISVKGKLPKGVYEFYGGWSQTEIGDNNSATSGTTTLARALDSTDNYKTKQVAGDDRPNDAPIPEPDHQTMYAFYAGSQYNIDIVLSYSKNNNYNPDKTKKSCEGEGEALKAASERRQLEANAVKFLSPVFLAGFLIVGSISIVLVIKSVKQKRRKASKRKKLLDRSLSRRGKK